MELLFLRKTTIKAKPMLIVRPGTEGRCSPAVPRPTTRAGPMLPHVALPGAAKARQQHPAQCCSTRGRHRAASVQPELPHLVAGQMHHFVPLGAGAGGAVHEELCTRCCARGAPCPAVGAKALPRGCWCAAQEWEVSQEEAARLLAASLQAQPRGCTPPPQTQVEPPSRTTPGRLLGGSTMLCA